MRAKVAFVAAGLIVLLALASGVESKFVQSSSSEELTPANFKSKVLSGNELWVVVFYAPWCGHCKALASEWEKLAGALAPSVRVGAVDADQHKELGGQYAIQGFPTIKIFGSNKNAPQDYSGARTAAAIAQGALKILQDQVMTKLGAGPKPKSSGGSKGGSGKEYAIMLTDSDFDEKVFKSDDEWMVQFMAPWCGHCQKLKPEWEEAAKQLDGAYKFGIVDATAETNLGKQYNIKGYPTIKQFKRGMYGKKEMVDYDGERSAAGLVRFVEARLDELGTSAPIPEITNQEAFNSECNTERTGTVCVIAFLPHILDDRAAGRAARLEKLVDARRRAGRTFRFMWVVGGENSELEEKLGLGFGFPAVVALSPTKKRFSVMRQAFSADNIYTYLSSVLRGKEPTAEAKPWPWAFRKADPWDGKDPTEPAAETDSDDE